MRARLDFGKLRAQAEKRLAQKPRKRAPRLGATASRSPTRPHGLPIREFQAGCQKAFSAIYERFRHPIRGYIASRVPDSADQEELIQETFLKAFRFRDSYDPTYEFSTWLWTVARNTVSDWLRKHRPDLDTAAADLSPELSVEDFPCGQRNAEAHMIHRSQRRNLIRLFRHLTRPQRRVLWLRVIHQHSYQEIGRQLGLSLPSVKNLSLRAKTKLAQVANSQFCLA